MRTHPYLLALMATGAISCDQSSGTRDAGFLADAIVDSADLDGTKTDTAPPPEDFVQKYGIVDRTESWADTKVLTDLRCAHPAMTFDSQGNKHIAFVSGAVGSQELELVSFVSGQWNRQTIDGASNYIEGVSISSTAEDELYVAYGRVTNSEPKVAYMDGSEWKNDVVGVGSIHGTFPVIYLDAAGSPAVFYKGAPTRARSYYSDLYRSKLLDTSWQPALLGSEGTSITVAIDSGEKLYVAGVRWDSPYPLSVYTDALNSDEKLSGGTASETYDIGFDSANNLLVVYETYPKLEIRKVSDTAARELLAHEYRVQRVYIDDESDPLRVFFSVSETGSSAPYSGVYVIEVEETQLSYSRISKDITFSAAVKRNGKISFVQCDRDSLHLLEEK